MEQLRITKYDFLRLAAIIRNQHPQNEKLLIEEYPICWKISSVDPATEQKTLKAFINKNFENENTVLDRNRADRFNIYDQREELPPTLGRHESIHSQWRDDSTQANQNY